MASIELRQVHQLVSRRWCSGNLAGIQGAVQKQVDDLLSRQRRLVWAGGPDTTEGHPDERLREDLGWKAQALLVRFQHLRDGLPELGRVAE
jgi:hypothetical protein